jgi:hypothetical protein
MFIVSLRWQSYLTEGFFAVLCAGSQQIMAFCCSSQSFNKFMAVWPSVEGYRSPARIGTILRIDPKALAQCLRRRALTPE